MNNLVALMAYYGRDLYVQPLRVTGGALSVRPPNTKSEYKNRESANRRRTKLMA